MAAVTCASAACGPRNYSNQNDELRRERIELRDRIAALESQVAECEAKVRRDSAPGAPVNGFDAAEVALATPVCATVEVDRYTGLADRDGDGAPDRVVVRVRTLDGRTRFTQVVGSIAVQADVVREGSDPSSLGRAELGPVAVRDSYRGGLGGPWYEVAVPIVAGVGRAGDRVVVTVRVRMASGGEVEGVRVLDGLWERFEVAEKNP